MMPALRWVAVAAIVLSWLSLASLHFLSPEYDPAWRVVSEYANGRYPFVLSLMFFAWGTGSIALGATLWSVSRKRQFRTGLVFLFLAGLGEILAAFFDLHHPLHDVAGALGLLGTPIAAWLIGRSQKLRPVWVSLLPALGLLGFAVTFAVLIATYSASGVTIDPNAKDVQLPPGVIALVGWANRALIVLYGIWVVIAASRNRLGALHPDLPS